MKLTGVHLLLTYACNLECDHCFVFGSPRQHGTMTLETIEEILRQAEALGTVEWIYFEGGEPFLHYAVMARGVEAAAARGFKVGIVSNGYWATDLADAMEWLRPLRGLVEDLSISRDPYHAGGWLEQETAHACAAAEALGIPVGAIRIAQPEDTSAAQAIGQLPTGESSVRYRGRAADMLSPRAVQRPASEFTSCPCEDLREPGRVHVDAFGDVHVCQGIRVGNVHRAPLSEICATYDPDALPVIGPILRGGPARLVLEENLEHDERYADACHLCFTARRALRERYPEMLGPDQMYGVGCG